MIVSHGFGRSRQRCSHWRAWSVSLIAKTPMPKTKNEKQKNENENGEKKQGENEEHEDEHENGW